MEQTKVAFCGKGKKHGGPDRGTGAPSASVGDWVLFTAPPRVVKTTSTLK